jgi:CelD/BcsL family acetyltransferase involved in cellulose biosynthesis
MVLALSQVGFVRMGLMLQGDFPVAAQIWLVHDHRATIFKLAYNQTAAAWSPGTLLTHWMLSRLISDEQIKEVDFGRGDDPYKRDWFGQVRPRFGLVAGNSQSISGWRTIIREVWPTLISNII